MKNYLVFDAKNTGYTPEQVSGKITVKDLKELLEEYDDDLEVITSFDNGYTYGTLPYAHEEEFEE